MCLIFSVSVCVQFTYDSRISFAKSFPAFTFAVFLINVVPAHHAEWPPLPPLSALGAAAGGGKEIRDRFSCSADFMTAVAPPPPFRWFVA